MNKYKFQIRDGDFWIGGDCHLCGDEFNGDDLREAGIYDALLPDGSEIGNWCIGVNEYENDCVYDESDKVWTDSRDLLLQEYLHAIDDFKTWFRAQMCLERGWELKEARDGLIWGDTSLASLRKLALEERKEYILQFPSGSVQHERKRIKEVMDKELMRNTAKKLLSAESYGAGKPKLDETMKTFKAPKPECRIETTEEEDAHAHCYLTEFDEETTIFCGLYNGNIGGPKECKLYSEFVRRCQLTRLEKVKEGLIEDPYKNSLTHDDAIGYEKQEIRIDLSCLDWAIDISKKEPEIGFDDMSGEEFELH